jgi:hypothetical protein
MLTYDTPATDGRNLIILSQVSYRYPISWEAFLDLSDSYFLFADLVGISEVLE